MKGALAQINDWLDAVKADRRLTANSVFKVAWQLTRKLSSKEFGKTGGLTTWQGIETLAAATGLSERMVRYAVRQLEATGYLAIKTGHGPRQSNRYTLIEQKRQPIAEFPNANTVNRLPHSGEQKRQSSVSNAATHCAESGNPLPPNSLNNSFFNSSKSNPDTGASGPRQRVDALGPPLGELDADLRQCLGERFKWLSMAKLAERDDTSLTLSVLTVYQGDNIRKYCEADILAAAGVSRLEFKVEPTKARRPR